MFLPSDIAYCFLCIFGDQPRLLDVLQRLIDFIGFQLLVQGHNFKISYTSLSSSVSAEIAFRYAFISALAIASALRVASELEVICFETTCNPFPVLTGL